MMRIPQQQHQGYAEQRAAAIARRQRMYAAGKAVEAIAPPKQVIAPKRPAHASMDTRFSHHILAYRSETSPYFAMMYMTINAGFTLDDVYRKNVRQHDIVVLKNNIAVMFRKKFDLSLPMIGKLMKVDHTTILHRLKDLGIRARKPKPPTLAEKIWQPGVSDKARAMFEAGASPEAMENDMGIPSKMIRDKGREEGWYVSPKDMAYRRFMADADKAELMRMVRSGRSIEYMAAKLRSAPSAIRRYINDHLDR